VIKIKVIKDSLGKTKTNGADRRDGKENLLYFAGLLGKT
jgi:hypothetical protein